MIYKLNLLTLANISYWSYQTKWGCSSKTLECIELSIWLPLSSALFKAEIWNFLVWPEQFLWLYVWNNITWAALDFNFFIYVDAEVCVYVYTLILFSFRYFCRPFFNHYSGWVHEIPFTSYYLPPDSQHVRPPIDWKLHFYFSHSIKGEASMQCSKEAKSKSLKDEN